MLELRHPVELWLRLRLREVRFFSSGVAVAVGETAGVDVALVVGAAVAEVVGVADGELVAVCVGAGEAITVSTGDGNGVGVSAGVEVAVGEGCGAGESATTGVAVGAGAGSSASACAPRMPAYSPAQSRAIVRIRDRIRSPWIGTRCGPLEQRGWDSTHLTVDHNLRSGAV